MKALLKSGLFFSLLTFALPLSAAKAQTIDPAIIGAASGEKTTVAPDGVVRISWPRSDVPVTVDGVALKPFAGLGSWAAFTGDSNNAMLMGDTVVFQDEVNPAIEAAFAAGLEVTGLHNHFFYDNPKVYFMHIGGHASADKLAAGVKSVWGAIRAVRIAKAQPATDFGGPAVKDGIVDPKPLESIVGVKPEVNEGVVKFTIGRDGTMHGFPVSGSMGLTTWAAFSGTNEMAAIDGDFMMTADEIQPVLRSLKGSKINIVALHNHMVGEKPAVYFTHYWGKASAADLAKAFKAALVAQSLARKNAK